MAYIPDKLIKYDCFECDYQFILSAYVVEKCKSKIQCPYCGSNEIEANAWISEDLLDELGCFGIYHRHMEEGE